MAADFDIAVIGSGFAGSLMATIASQLGYRVVLVERGTHPRFAIGESASPLAGILIEQLADRYALPRLRPLGSYGEWQRRYPQLGCGLKRGFTYFKHEAGRPYRAAFDRGNQLLVASSVSDDDADTHWLRTDVDHFLVGEAQAAGVEYADRVTIESIDWQPSTAIVRGTRASQPFAVRASFIIDASGAPGVLSRLRGIATPGFAEYPGTQALYSHFVDVARCADMPDYASSDAPPYPIDAAALHHVFDEGWMWVLRFDNGVTSAGVAVTERLAAELRLADGEAAWQRLLARYPTVAAQFGDARPIRAFTWMPRLATRCAVAAGERWAMLPSAAAFVDPLFSTGMPLALLGIERMARALEDRRPDQAGPPYGPPYSNTTLAEADHTARFIANCYAAFPRFEQFTAHSMFYFVAASYAEMKRRAGEPAGGFLRADDAAYAAAMRNLSAPETIAAACAPYNIAGLCDPRQRNWYSAAASGPV